jgi:hypothetical protein
MFDRNDHLEFMPLSGWYHLIVGPIVEDVKLI